MHISHLSGVPAISGIDPSFSIAQAWIGRISQVTDSGIGQMDGSQAYDSKGSRIAAAAEMASRHGAFAFDRARPERAGSQMDCFELKS